MQLGRTMRFSISILLFSSLLLTIFNGSDVVGRKSQRILTKVSRRVLFLPFLLTYLSRSNNNMTIIYYSYCYANQCN